MRFFAFILTHFISLRYRLADESIIAYICVRSGLVEIDLILSYIVSIKFYSGTFLVSANVGYLPWKGYPATGYVMFNVVITILLKHFIYL